MSETVSETGPRPHATAPTQEQESRRERFPWERALVWTVIVVALALVAVATVFLFLGLLEMIAVVSPLLVAVLLVWCTGLTVKVLDLDRRLKAKNPE